MAEAFPRDYPPAQPQLPTPSPFSYSIASTAWSSRPSFRLSHLIFRSLALLFSFVSAFSIAAPSSNKSFGSYPELRYCLAVTIFASVYSAVQLFKGICNIAHRGFLISDMISDYLSFIFDHLVCYLLISSSTVSVTVIGHLEATTSLWKAAIVSVSMSFAAFLVFAVCTLFSGYKLCKRVISW